jgi:hypothetical protein
MAATPTVSPGPMSHEISSNDHAPLVTIATCLMLTGSIIALAMRFAIRWPWSQLLGLDDAAIIAGSVLGIGQSIAIFKATQFGLGRHSNALTSLEVEHTEQVGHCVLCIILSEITDIISSRSTLVTSCSSSPLSHRSYQ